MIGKSITELDVLPLGSILHLWIVRATFAISRLSAASRLSRLFAELLVDESPIKRIRLQQLVMTPDFQDPS